MCEPRHVIIDARQGGCRGKGAAYNVRGRYVIENTRVIAVPVFLRLSEFQKVAL